MEKIKLDMNILESKQKSIQNQMSKMLIEIRVANKIQNTFIVTRELGLSSAALRNIEKGLSFPATKTLNELIEFYIVTPKEKEELLRLKNEMLHIRRKMKLARLRTGER